MTMLLSLLILTQTVVPALAYDYSFSSGNDTLGLFGHSTSTDEPVSPDPMNSNTRRNKDAAYLPPPYGIFSGDIPTDLSSPYHDNARESGFAPTDQDLPPTGGENLASGFLPSTSQTAAQSTAPWYYPDGSIGTLYVGRTGRTIKVYEGETLDNLEIGAGHFSATSAWDGNAALAGHNRGSSAYFSFVKDLENGDTLTYTTKYGTRTYKVYAKTQINEWDNLPLLWSEKNILTLITCQANVPENRICVIAREV